MLMAFILLLDTLTLDWIWRWFHLLKPSLLWFASDIFILFALLSSFLVILDTLDLLCERSQVLKNPIHSGLNRPILTNFLHFWEGNTLLEADEFPIKLVVACLNRLLSEILHGNERALPCFSISSVLFIGYHNVQEITFVRLLLVLLFTLIDCLCFTTFLSFTITRTVIFITLLSLMLVVVFLLTFIFYFFELIDQGWSFVHNSNLLSAAIDILIHDVIGKSIAHDGDQHVQENDHNQERCQDEENVA